MNEDISVFICEDKETSRQIIAKYFSEGKVTYAALFLKDDRAKIVEELDKLQ